MTNYFTFYTVKVRRIAVLKKEKDLLDIWKLIILDLVTSLI